MLFEIFRLVFDTQQMARLKDYEEYKLKELYSVIINDQGSPRGFNKKQTMKPTGYTLQHLKGLAAKLTHRNRRILMSKGTMIEERLSNAYFDE
mmetsp:Transcript_27706/g.26734  ORF Transcript_27706/g.26734 Transcript_27706/m.26734 type:complete len:93 (+) Transcript_27706:920-1198(+)